MVHYCIMFSLNTQGLYYYHFIVSKRVQEIRSMEATFEKKCTILVSCFED